MVQVRHAHLDKAYATLAWILLANAGLGLLVWGSRSVFGDAPPSLPWAGLLGVVSALACLRGRTSGLWGALLFYVVQVAIYHPVTHGVAFGTKAGISLAGVYVLSGGILVVNYAALLLLSATAVLLYRLKPALPTRPTP